MLHDKIIVFAFNAKLADGCDYATQTMQLLGSENHVYALLLGEPRTWKDAIQDKRLGIVSQKYRSTLIRPFFFVPGQRFSYIRTVNYFLNAVALRILLSIRYVHQQKLLWFFEPWNIPVVWLALFGYTSVYDCVDYYQDLGSDWQKSENFLIPRVSEMACHSHALAALHKKKRFDIHVVPLGFPADVFSQYIKPLTNRRSLIVGYIGGINYRLDFRLLTHLVKRLPRVTFVFVGPIQLGLIPEERGTLQKIEAFFSLPNVRYLGEVSKAEIGTHIASFTAGIIPYDITYRFNRYCFPMKVMEYFWFGLPVVSTDIVELRRFPGYIRIGISAEAWIKALQSLRRERDRTTRIPARRIALLNTWERKIEAISQIVDAPGQHS